jgi:hypothetical protein
LTAHRLPQRHRSRRLPGVLKSKLMLVLLGVKLDKMVRLELAEKQ